MKLIFLEVAINSQIHRKSIGSEDPLIFIKYCIKPMMQIFEIVKFGFLPCNFLAIRSLFNAQYIADLRNKATMHMWIL